MKRGQIRWYTFRLPDKRQPAGAAALGLSPKANGCLADDQQLTFDRRDRLWICAECGEIHRRSERLNHADGSYDVTEGLLVVL